jgi:hypothetical protein
MTCRLTSRQRPKYAHATIEKVLQEVFSVWYVPYPLLGNGSLNTFPRRRTRDTMGHLLLGNGAVDSLCQQYRLCFPWGPRNVVIRELISEVGSSVKMSGQLWSFNQRATEAEEFPLLRFATRKRLVKTLERNSHCGELLPRK